MINIDNLNFDNQALKRLPIDPEKGNYTRSVKNACFSLVEPTSVKNPKVVAVSLPALKLLGLPESETKRNDFVDYFCGNKAIPGCKSAAHCYCGHQFGHFSGQLGDGATMYLGEVVNHENERWEIQFKGAGLTPYSRSADGRKVLRSSIREFLCSEAMYHLGIPTTRAGSCVTSDTTVIRDIFYSGNPIKERATIVLRIAETFIRFGSFEICKTLDPYTYRSGPSIGNDEILVTLLHYVIESFYPDIWKRYADDLSTCYKETFREIVLRTARLVAEWQCVGWCHGVLNTDNMSIVGVTIDYGPYGFMDRYDPEFICNASDNGGRYSYENQPEMCKWNCMKLAESWHKIIDKKELAPILSEFDIEFKTHYDTKMRKKLGLMHPDDDDCDLIQTFLDTMEASGADFANCFRGLNKIEIGEDGDIDVKSIQLCLEYLISQCCDVQELIKSYNTGVDIEQLSALRNVIQVNPHILKQFGEQGIKLQKDIEKLDRIDKLEELTDQEKTTNDKKLWNDWLSLYSKRLKEDFKKESHNIKSYIDNRVKVMNENNPRFILRNYIAQRAIEKAEIGDFTEVNRVLKLLENPYSSDNAEELFLHVESKDSSQNVNDICEDGNACSSRIAESNSDSKCAFDCVSYESKPPILALSIKVT